MTRLLVTSYWKRNRPRRRTRELQPRLEAMEERVVLSLVAVSGNTSINPTQSTSQTKPAVAMDSAGDFVVVWLQTPNNNEADIEAQVYNSAGVAQLATPLTVNDTTNLNDLPSVAMDSNGDFVVTWDAYTLPSYVTSVYARKYALTKPSSGNYTVAAQGNQFEVTQSGVPGDDPKVAMDSLSDFVVTWQNYDTSGANQSAGVVEQLYTSAGAQGIHQVNTDTAGSQAGPAIAMDSAGNYVIAYQDNGIATAAGIYDRVYNSAGTAQTGDLAVNTLDTTKSSKTTPGDASISMEPTGQYVIAWEFTQTVGAGNDDFEGIEAQTFNAGGSAALSNPVVLSTSEDFSQGSAKVAIDSQGDFVVAWENYGVNSNHSLSTIVAQRVNAAGTLIGPNQFQPSTQPSSDNQLEPSIASNPSGNTFIAWSVRPSTTNDDGNAFGQLYDNDPPTINKPANLTIDENSGKQTVNLTGIASADGANHNLTVTASSSNSGLINPSVIYTSGNSTGTLTFTPTANQTGSATITLTETDDGGTSTSGNDTTQVQFTVTVNQINVAPTINQPANLTINENAGQQTVNLTGIAAGGGATQTLTVTASSNNSSLITPHVTYTSPSSTGTLTFTPTANDFGTATITVTVMESSAGVSGGVDETQVQFTVTVNQINVAPTITTPSSLTINENAGQQTVNLTGIAAGGGATQTLSVSASSNNTALINPNVTYTSPSSTGTLTFTPAANSFGTATITVTVMESGGTANGGVDETQVQFTVTVNQVAASVSAVSASWGGKSIALQTAADGLRLLPAGRKSDLPWYGINQLQITLSQAESLSAGDVSVTGITVANYGPVTVSGSGTNYTITLAQAITTADRVTVTIGTAEIATYTRRLDVLPGDVNDDGVVNVVDILAIRNDFTATVGTTYNIFDDINGDGVIDVNDTNVAGRFMNKKLPPLPPPA